VYPPPAVVAGVIGSNELSRERMRGEVERFRKW
jgi:hypothetical protein